MLLSAAADLFAENGYGNVSMKDVAAASNMSASSLYTHFASKNELLYEVIADQIDRSLSYIEDGSTAAPRSTYALSEIAAGLTAGVLAHRSLGVLWQREARSLDAAGRAELRRRLTGFGAVVRDALLVQRPDMATDQAALLTQCAFGAVTSISFHHQSLPRREFATLLSDLCLRMLLLEPAVATARYRARRRPITPRSGGRRQELADAAITLFARRGFSEVTIDDIGATVGIAGPSVYKHVKSKQELLQIAFDHSTAILRDALTRVERSSQAPTDAVRAVTDSYLALALDQADLITVLIGEAHHLDGEAQRHARHVQREYIDAWAALIHRIRDEAPTVTRIKIQAAQMVANDIGRTPHLHRVRGWRATVENACWTLQQ
ncbi:TetR/AcrR family transcriptional regulator [Tsukamurella soli]|uniref:TetR/AcrR family transcriptional regulator n=1 Tax=Tsukamurella soli TaxID=644556 RepID=UPI00360B448B